MEEAAVHGGAIQYSQCAAERERQDGLAAEFSGDLFEARSNLLESVVPADALPFLCGAPARGRWSLRPYSPQRIQNPVWGIYPIQILGHLRTQETTRHGMRGITNDFGRTVVLHSNQNAAGVRAIVRTGGVDDLLHKPSNYRVPLPQCAQDMALSAFSVYSAAVLRGLDVLRF